MKNQKNFDEAYDRSADFYHVSNSKNSSSNQTKFFDDAYQNESYQSIKKNIDYSNFDSKDLVNCDFTSIVISFTRRFIVCTFCKNEFASNARLHKHISLCISLNKNSSFAKSIFFTTLTEQDLRESTIDFKSIIKLTVSAVERFEYAFRDFQYATIETRFDIIEIKDEICLDIDCIMTLKDREFLKFRLFNYQSLIKRMTLSILVR